MFDIVTSNNVRIPQILVNLIFINFVLMIVKLNLESVA